MKVDKFQNYSLRISNSRARKNETCRVSDLSVNNSPAFTGAWGSFVNRIAPLKLSESAKIFINYLPKGEAKSCEIMTRIKDFAEGEAAGIGITAIGTGLVAPWPIAFNPIVNYQLKKRNATPEQIEEKHKTQKYSAWRQPVSAVLAVIFQLGVQKPIQLLLDHWTNDPKTASLFNGTIYNQAFLNGDKYLERKVAKEIGNNFENITVKYSESYEQLEKQVNEIVEAFGLDKMKIKSNSSKTAKMEYINGQIDQYIASLSAGENADVIEKLNSLKIPDRESLTKEGVVRSRAARDLADAIKGEKNNRAEQQIKEISEALKRIKEGDAQIKVGENIIPTRALAESFNERVEAYIKSAIGLKKQDLEEYVEKARQLITQEDTVKSVLAPENLEANINRIMKDNPNFSRTGALRVFLNEQKQIFEQNDNKDMVKILNRILRKCDKVIESSCGRTIERIGKIKAACEGTFTPGTYFDYMYSKRNVLLNEKIDNLIQLLIPKEQWETLTPSELQERIRKVIDVCHYKATDKTAKQVFKDNGVFLSVKEELADFVYKDIIEKGYKEVVKRKNKVSSQIVKACIATFIMLPITCTALNWVYPRFMDLFFPGLSGKKDKTPKTLENGGVEKC